MSLGSLETALPSPWVRNELVQRLRLKLAAELGLVGDHAAALKFLNPPPEVAADD